MNQLNKWIYRLIGLLVLAIMVLFGLDYWFTPDVPLAIQRELEVVNGETPQQSDRSITQQPTILQDDGALSLLSLDESATVSDTILDPATIVVDDAPALTLTALEGRDDEPAPILLHKPSSAPVLAETASIEAVWLQAGSFAERNNAEKLATQFKAKGWSVDIGEAKIGDKQYHRVYIGPLKKSVVPNYLKVLGSMSIQAREVKR